MGPGAQRELNEVGALAAVEGDDAPAVGHAPKHVTQVEELGEEAEWAVQWSFDGERMNAHGLVREQLADRAGIWVGARVSDAADAAGGRRETQMARLERRVERELGYRRRGDSPTSALISAWARRVAASWPSCGPSKMRFRPSATIWLSPSTTTAPTGIVPATYAAHISAAPPAGVATIPREG